MNISISSMKVMLAAVMMMSSNVALAMADHHEISDNITTAVARPERSDKDRRDDAWRKPAEVLSFAGIKEGMTVLDVNSGHGYYSEILSHAVGEKGKVVAHNGVIYWNYVKNDVAERYTGRLANVTQLYTGKEEVEWPKASVDAAVLMIAFHDYYHYLKPDVLADTMPAILASIKDTLKDGGVFVLSDHAARVGAAPEFEKTLHRIDPEFVKKQVLAAGFKFVESSDALSNPDDDYSLGVFNEKVRHKTDRFILKFTK